MTGTKSELPARGREQGDRLPASQQLGTISRWGRARLVTLPPAFADGAVRKFAQWHRASVTIVEGPGLLPGLGRELKPDEWAIRWHGWNRVPFFTTERVGDVGTTRGGAVSVCPRHAVLVSPADARRVLSALEEAKPEERDEDGRPLPWVPVEAPRVSVGAGVTRDEDVALVGDHEPLPDLTEIAPPADAPIPDRTIRELHERLCAGAGLSPVPLELRRGTESRRGFVAGRVWYGPTFRPRRITLTTCPNADLAEIAATLVHELAHPLSQTTKHGRRFKETLVGLAAAEWGEAHFVEAKERLREGFHEVDLWVTSGIRAAMAGDSPPRAKQGDDGRMAGIVSRLRALRARARDQLGRWEGVIATALANDIVTLYGLESYQVRVDAGIHDQMVDRWVPIEKRKVWKRSLAHAVARFCDVFSLAVPKRGMMHYFGTYGDVVAAEYLYQISEERIERDCEAHIRRWKGAMRSARPRAADTRSERVAFCDSAEKAFREKLRAIARARNGGAPRSPGRDEDEDTSPSVATAEAFARAEHEKRGRLWSSGTGKYIRPNAAGAATGRAMQVVRGLDSGGGAPRRLEG